MHVLKAERYSEEALVVLSIYLCITGKQKFKDNANITAENIINNEAKQI